MQVIPMIETARLTRSDHLSTADQRTKTLRELKCTRITQRFLVQQYLQYRPIQLCTIHEDPIEALSCN